MAEIQSNPTAASGSGHIASTVQAFAGQYDTVSERMIYSACIKLYEKLEAAMAKGELDRFLQERGSYRQRYGLLNSTNRALRALCICITLNAYSSDHPEFAPKLSETVTQVIRSGKRARTAAFTVAQQWLFQRTGSSGLPLVDRQLREDTVSCLKKQKTRTLLLGLLLVFVPSEVMITLSMNGVKPEQMLFLFPIVAVLSIWGLLKLVSLIAISNTIRNLNSEPSPAAASGQKSGQA